MAKNPRVRAGLLRERIIVQTVTTTKGSSGQPVESWAGYKRWASIEPLRGQELEVARQNNERITHRVLLRYDERTKSITVKDRLKHQARLLHVEGIYNVQERDRTLELVCREAV